MPSRENRPWVMASRPDPAVRADNFRLESVPTPVPGPGQFLVRTLYLSLAPVMRMYMIDGAGIEKPLEVGETMRGRGVGEVVASNHPGFAVGDVVQGKLGWQEYALADGSPYYMMYKVTQRLVPFSTALGVLGFTGFTAYLGLTQVGRIRPGETVLVSGAAGGVGSNCGFVARNLGCRAVGIAGTDEKCRLLVTRLGYDAAINYRTEDVEKRIGSLEFYVGVLGFQVLWQREIDNPYFGEIVGFPGRVVKGAHLSIPGSGHHIELFEYLVRSGNKGDLGTNNVGVSHLSFLVDDLPAAYEELKAKGVRFRSPPVLITGGANKGGWGVYLQDPDGITVELFQPPIGSRG